MGTAKTSGILGRSFVVAAAVLGALLAEPVVAGEMDLTIGVRTARPTTVLPVRYLLIAWPNRTPVVDSGEGDGTNEVTADLHVVTPAACKLLTTFGEFAFSVAEDGAISVPAGSPLSVSGSTLIIENSVDLPDFGIRMRKPTTLKGMEFRPTTVTYSEVRTSVTPASRRLDGATAGTPIRWPLLGLAPNTGIVVNTTLGARFVASVTATGELTVPGAPDELPVSVDSEDPQVLVIENTVDLPYFAMRVAKPTTAVHVWYRVTTSWEYFAHYPGPPELPTHPTVDMGLTYYPGPTAHTDTVAFPLKGLAPNQTIQIGSVYGGEIYRVQADGSLLQESTGPRIAFDGDTAVVQNMLDIPGFRIRLANPVNAQLVHMGFSIYSTPGNAISMSEVTLQPIAGEDAYQGIAFPLLGIVPGLVFPAATPIAGLHVLATDSGGLEVVNPVSPPRGRIVEIDGGPQLVIDNPISVRCRVYGEYPIPWLGADAILGAIEFTWAPAPIDPADEGHWIYKACDGAEWPTGVQFVLQNMGPYTALRSPTGFGTYWMSGITFRLNLDGTATFLAPARQLTPW